MAYFSSSRACWLGAGDGGGASLQMGHEEIFRGDGNILKAGAGTFLATLCSQCKAKSLIPGREDPLEKEMATHSSILAWRILWTEEPTVGYSPPGSQRVGHD